MDIIDDAIVSTTKTWSSKKINDELTEIKNEIETFIETIISDNEIDALFN